MKENKLADMSMSFSVQVINLVKDLKSKHESIISRQKEKPANRLVCLFARDGFERSGPE